MWFLVRTFFINSFLNSGGLEVHNSYISNNYASAQGGAFFIAWKGQVLLDSVVISNNHADDGGVFVGRVLRCWI